MVLFTATKVTTLNKLRTHIPFPELVIRTLKLRRIYYIPYLHNATGKGLLPRGWGGGDDIILWLEGKLPSFPKEIDTDLL